MAVTFVALSREYTLSVGTDGNTYTTVSGLNNLTWKKDTNTADLTVFDSRGIQVDAPVSAKLTLAFEGLHAFTDSTLATRDAGQTILFAADSATSPNGAYIYGKLAHTTASGQMTFTGYVMLDETGGGNDDPMMIKGTIALTDRPTGTGHFTNQLGDQ